MKRTGLLLTVLSLACLLRGSAQDRIDPQEGDQFTVDYMEGEDKKRDPKRLKGDETRSQVKTTHYHLKNLKYPDPSIRENSCEMLGIVGSKEGIPHLIEALLDRHIMVQIMAHGALAKITGQNFGYKKYDTWKKWFEQHERDGCASVDFDVKKLERKVSLEFKATPLEECVIFIQSLVKIPLVQAPGIKETLITLRVSDTPILEVLEKLCAEADIELRVGKSGCILAPKTKP